MNIYCGNFCKFKEICNLDKIKTEICKIHEDKGIDHGNELILNRTKKEINTMQGGKLK